MGLEGTHEEISEPFYQLRKAAASSNQSFGRVALELNDHFLVPSSAEYDGGRDVGSVPDERKEDFIHLSSPPSINAHGVLGQILFDVCVPKNVEDWDMRSSHFSNLPPFASTRRHSSFNPIKCILRSRPEIMKYQKELSMAVDGNFHFAVVVEVLVTGASGYLGGRLCHALLKHGHSVRAFVRPTSDLSSIPPPTDGDGALELAYGDVTDYQSLLAACSGCHAIFHAAALVEPWLPEPSRFFLVNVGGLRNVLQAYKEIKTVEKIIYTSSFFALGSTDGYVADESQIHPGKYFCTDAGLSWSYYGPGKVTAGNVVARLIIERFNGRLPGYIGYGNDKFSFSHVDDVVDGHIAALNKGRPGERYLLTGENASFMHVFDISAVMTETRRPWFNIPLLVIEAYGWISVLFSRITGKLPLISPPTVRVLRHQWAYSCEKAKIELDYNPRSLKEGLAEVLPWLKELGFYKILEGICVKTLRVLRHQWAYSCEKAKIELDCNPRSLKEGLAEIKRAKPRADGQKEVVMVRRSNRVANKPAPDYNESVTYVRFESPRKYCAINLCLFKI
ncbi:hypothetical protein F0562_027274 [Nyssa sinensis]|uniref:NAD-dependent epimerase/dehydratase domain-containing protein n=1 Tax=Nyssa sinensis TaxID=561372 RepID=A0A5J5B624_9ASTE|nr:hypothetical protein F0562_027274 [Nyssa sinensis]